jgi:thioredoxin 1
MGSAQILEVTDATFDAEVLQSKIPVIVDFWAPWCAPCRAIAPILDDLAQKNAGRIKVVKVNLDDNMEAAQRYRVTAIPTVLIIKEGQVAEQVVGGKSAHFFAELVERHV